MENINKKELVKEIKLIEKLIIQHKGNLRRPHFSYVSNGKFIEADPKICGDKLHTIRSSQSCLIKLKKEVTLFYSLKAYLRGKIHMNGITFAEQVLLLVNSQKQIAHLIDEKIAA